MISKIQRNNFGVLSKDYDAARRGYPDELFKYLKKVIQNKNAKILDCGCGTGISTRQLKKYKFNVVGADKDSAMIQIAKSKRDKISYVVAPAHKLPFKNGEFDVVTAFTAFHWFADKRSINEIKRVLKNGGMFIDIQKRSSRADTKQLKKITEGYWAILQKYFGDRADSQKNYDSEMTLKKNGFQDITYKTFSFMEKYTLFKAMMLLRSLSNWNLLSDDLKPKFYAEIGDLYKKNLIDGYVFKNKKVKMVIGYLNRKD